VKVKVKALRLRGRRRLLVLLGNHRCLRGATWIWGWKDDITGAVFRGCQRVAWQSWVFLQRLGSINFGTILGPLKWDLFWGNQTMQIYGHFQGNFPYNNALFGLVIFMTPVQNRLFGF